MEEKLKSVVKTGKIILMVIGAVTVAAGVIYLVYRFLQAREEALYGWDGDDEEDEGAPVDPDIAGEFEA